MRTIALLAAFILFASLGAGDMPAQQRGKAKSDGAPSAGKDSVSEPKPDNLQLRVYPVGEFPEVVKLLKETLLADDRSSWSRIDYYPAVGSLVVCNDASVQDVMAVLLPKVAAAESVDAKKQLVLQCAYEFASAHSDAKTAKQFAQMILEIDPTHFAKMNGSILKEIEARIDKEFKPQGELIPVGLMPPAPAKIHVEDPTPAEVEFLRKALQKDWKAKGMKIPEYK